MTPPSDLPEPEAPRYQVEFTEPALVEADTLYLRLSEQSGPEYASRWYAGLFKAAAELARIPRIHAIARENDRYDVEIRRLLYSGPSRRRSGTIYRVLFHIVDPVYGDTDGLVRVLHIWHGAQADPPASPP